MTRIHPVTGEILKRDIRSQTISHGDQSVTINVPGWYPEGDGDAIHTGRDLKEWNEVWKKLRG